MKKQIFYFTATGNSLAVARGLAAALGDYEIHSISPMEMALKDGEERNIVVVTPVYMYNIPHIVRNFLLQIDGPGNCSIVFTGGGEAGKSFGEAEKIFLGKVMNLTSIFNFSMPSNYTPFGIEADKKMSLRLAEARSRFIEVAEQIKKGTAHRDKDGTGFFKAYIAPGILYAMGYRYLNFMDKNFLSDEKCTGCGICARVCPVDNIVLTDGRPVWNKKCEQCFACLQWCPEEAIQYGRKTAGVKRYRHPEIELKDILGSRKHS